MNVVNLKPRKSNHRYHGFALFRIAMVLVGLMALLEIGAAGAARVFDGHSMAESLVPTTSPFREMNVGLGLIGAERPRPAIERLMAAAERMARQTSVPYVFGGTRIGTAKQCQECSDCARKNHLSANSSSGRFNKCASCRRCGIDCSNFVNRLFSEAGLKYRFADTRTLTLTGEDFLQEQYGFINMGRDLLVARPGDLILQKGHVMMVIDVDPTLGTIDYIHASRGSRTRKPIGGIELRRGKPLNQVQHEVVKILRHRELVLPDDSDIILGSLVPSAKSLWNGMRQMFASNN